MISRSPYAYVNAERKLVQRTFCVYKDDKGAVGSIVIDKAAPTDAEIKRAVEERAKKRLAE